MIALSGGTIAGVLAAYGTGLADVIAIADEDVLKIIDSGSFDDDGFIIGVGADGRPTVKVCPIDTATGRPTDGPGCAISAVVDAVAGTVSGWVRRSLTPADVAAVKDAIAVGEEVAAILKLEQSNPCAYGCDDPEAHAEGGHDI